jgi:cytochrome c oxidase assembly protein subunit 15
VLAVATLAAVLGFVFWAPRFRLSLGSQGIIGALAAMVLVQVGLGVSTLLLYVPVWLGALHQAGALILLTLALLTTQRLRRLAA